CLLLPATGVRGAPVEAGPVSWADPSKWVVEQRPGRHVRLEEGTLEIRDGGGCTVGWRNKLTAPVDVRYTAIVLMEGGELDGLSGLNSLWTASDAAHPASLGCLGHGRTGAQAD